MAAVPQVMVSDGQGWRGAIHDRRRVLDTAFDPGHVGGKRLEQGIQRRADITRRELQCGCPLDQPPGIGQAIAVGDQPHRVVHQPVGVVRSQCREALEDGNLLPVAPALQQLGREVVEAPEILGVLSGQHVIGRDCPRGVATHPVIAAFDEIPFPRRQPACELKGLFSQLRRIRSTDAAIDFAGRGIRQQEQRRRRRTGPDARLPREPQFSGGIPGRFVDERDSGPCISRKRVEGSGGHALGSRVGIHLPPVVADSGPDARGERWSSIEHAVDPGHVDGGLCERCTSRDVRVMVA